MEFIFIIPIGFIILILLAVLGLGMQAVIWLAENIMIISVVLWAVILFVVIFFPDSGERLLTLSYVCPFFPFYMGLVAMVFQWADLLGNGGIGNLINFIMYVFAIPIGLVIHLVPSILILYVSEKFGKGSDHTIALLNFSLTAVYILIMYSNGGALIT